MQLEHEYFDFLQNIEFAVLSTYKDDPALRDVEVMKAYDRLIKHYKRVKKKMPPMQSTLSGRPAEVYNNVYDMIEWRREKSDGEPEVELEDMPGVGGDVPIVIVIRCLEKLLKSAKNWNKRDGHRGYLTLLETYVK
ncbi:MAG TPA: hypothetical protein ENJ95_17365 [Bacteroidetes bacterium]|nr:hypothetical protein [Bacteroidota bacterium]